MDETAKLIFDYGITGAIILGLALLFIRYLPKLIDIFIERLKKRDYRDDLLMKTIENNSRVIENNNIITKNYTDNSHKLEDNLKDLVEIFREHDKRAEMMASDIKIVKSRKGE